MNRKLIAGELLCAALLLGCTAPPKLSVPSGDWVDIALPPPLIPPATTAPPAAAPSTSQGPVKALPSQTGPIPAGQPAVSVAGTPAAAGGGSVTSPQATLRPILGTMQSAPGKPIGPAVPGVVQVASAVPQLPKKEIPTVAPPKVFGSTPPVPIEALITPSAKPAPPPKPKEIWSVSPQDVNVRRALMRWADKAGWQVEWQASEDILISSSASFEGDFKSAVDQLFSALTTTDVGLVPMRYKNKVIRVTESGKRAK